MLELVLVYSLKFNLTFGELSHITRMEFIAMKKSGRSPLILAKQNQKEDQKLRSDESKNKKILNTLSL